MDVQSSSTLPLPPARRQPTSTNVRSSTPRRACFQNWRGALTIGGIILFVVILVSLLSIFLTMRKKDTLHDCKVTLTVSKAEKSNFRTISEAVDAAPNNSPFNVCISVLKGEYHEIIKIGPKKINLILIGVGFNKTSITSNSSFDDANGGSTLGVDGTGFMAQDLSIINTAYMGIAVDNAAINSIFFRCQLVGRNRTLCVQKHNQYYRDCLLHGGNHLILGDGSAFFQKCQFFSENLDHEKEIIFSGHHNKVSFFKTGLIFHLCKFHIVGNLTAPNVFLGNAIGSGASIVVMQCYFDEYLAGYFIENPTWNNTFFALFDNHGPGATIRVPPSVHALKNAEATDFSLRSFFKEAKWKPSNRVECNLDLG